MTNDIRDLIRKVRENSPEEVLSYLIQVFEQTDLSSIEELDKIWQVLKYFRKIHAIENSEQILLLEKKITTATRICLKRENYVHSSAFFERMRSEEQVHRVMGIQPLLYTVVR